MTMVLENGEATGIRSRAVSPAALPLRDPDEVMRLSHLGAAHLSRLSFSRTLVRTVREQGWSVERRAWNLDVDGYGHAIYVVTLPGGCECSLVAFSHYLAPEDRIDRVIATAWDTSYVLYDGIPGSDEIARLKALVPKQEAARYTERELILARANRSVRIFDEILAALSAGRQPDLKTVRETGYALRTSAIYGNGKFGIADREKVEVKPGLGGAFAAEMLTVWLIRAFAADLLEHCAHTRAPDRAVPLEPAIRRELGIGNATGLGMAPFLIRHPVLLHRWSFARETALARIRAVPAFLPAERARLAALAAAAADRAEVWVTAHELQARRIAELRVDLARLKSWIPTVASPDALFRHAMAELRVEAAELVISLLIDTFGALSDDLPASMAGDEVVPGILDAGRTVGAMRDAIELRYGWATRIDFSRPDETARFWYTSQEKLEPRVGWRGEDEGDELELPLGVGREAAILAARLAELPPEKKLAEVLIVEPWLRQPLRRLQIAMDHPYGEIRDNVLAATHWPVDLMRCKLSFLGCEYYDPGADLGIRVRFFQGAPYPHEIGTEADDVLVW